LYFEGLTPDFNLPLAATIGLNPRDKVQWELLDRDEIRILRLDPGPPPTPYALKGVNTL